MLSFLEDVTEKVNRLASAISESTNKKVELSYYDIEYDTEIKKYYLEINLSHVLYTCTNFYHSELEEFLINDDKFNEIVEFAKKEYLSKLDDQNQQKKNRISYLKSTIKRLEGDLEILEREK